MTRLGQWSVSNARYYWSDYLQKMRGAAGSQKSVIFLYPSRESAENSREEGASGFIVGIGSRVFSERGYYYAITNRHVVEEGISVIRVNAVGGGIDIVDLKPTDWITSPTEDLAACEVQFDLTKQDIECVDIESFLTERDIEQYEMGPGMESYVVGRFVAHSGKLRNQPASRFGVVSMLETEPVRQGDGHLQESFLVEMHSISGYSGSPVYIYISKQTPGTQITMGWDYKTWLLGVDWGHLHNWMPIVNGRGEKHPDWRVSINSGMMGVIPCWKLLEFLNSGELLESREKQEEEAFLEKHSAGILDKTPPPATQH